MVLILAALGCVARHEPVRADTPTPIDVVPVLAGVDDPAVTDAPERLDEALVQTLSAHNLQPTLVPADRWTQAFVTTRDTPRRVEHLAPKGNLLLVETEAAYFSQLNGRYRWTVDVTLTLVPAGLSDTFEVPVFLEFQHEREEQALAAATPVIARHVGDLVDDWLAGAP